MAPPPGRRPSRLRPRGGARGAAPVRGRTGARSRTRRRRAPRAHVRRRRSRTGSPPRPGPATEQAQAHQRESEANDVPSIASAALSTSSWRTGASSRCAERHPHGDLAVPRGGAHQQQVGDVRAGDEKHQRAGADEGEPDRVGHATEKLLIDRDCRRAKAVDPRGPSRDHRVRNDSSSACACSRVRPAARRPKTDTTRASRGVASDVAIDVSVVQTSVFPGTGTHPA